MSKHHIIVTPKASANDPTSVIRWYPRTGSETSLLIQRVLPNDSQKEIVTTAAQILGKGINPNQPSGASAGLVVGYVQSGKTLSFTTVAALARDNGFQLVVLIAGTSTPLLRQSTERLTSDLEVLGPGRQFDWVIRTNPGDTADEVRFLRSKFEEWVDPTVSPDDCPTVLITVMKHHDHLRNLTHIVRQLDLSQISVLIIDDEADQASLNTRVKSGKESTTYSTIRALRNAIPNHTFLQYTATPQANLLINMIDALSPNFVQVLEPGNNYIGGKQLFASQSKYTSVIPASDLIQDDQYSDGMTNSLTAALCDFIIGVASGIIDRSYRNGHRSMLVHPSRKTISHLETANNINAALAIWRSVEQLSLDDPDRIDLMGLFESGHTRIKRTFPSIQSFEEISSALRRVFRMIQVREVNARSGATPEIEWHQSYAWILVGGQAMDRGYTIEGLTVTYMPRGVGVGNADVIQQRGRFFGYKRDYIGLCRVYLEQDVITAFENYVKHEEHMRESLKKFQTSGQPLDQWRRLFVLSPDLKPCRDNVIQHGYLRPRSSSGWLSSELTELDDQQLDNARDIINGFVGNHLYQATEDNEGAPPSERHYKSDSVPIDEVIARLLAPCIGLTNGGGFGNSLAMLLTLIDISDSHPDERATVFRMRPNMHSNRSIRSNGRLSQIFQGPSAATATRARGARYPGDRVFHHTDQVTVQIHMFHVDGRSAKDTPKIVPALTIWLPERLRPDYLIQVQNKQNGNQDVSITVRHPNIN